MWEGSWNMLIPTKSTNISLDSLPTKVHVPKPTWFMIFCKTKHLLNPLFHRFFHIFSHSLGGTTLGRHQLPGDWCFCLHPARWSRSRSARPTAPRLRPPRRRRSPGDYLGTTNGQRTSQKDGTMLGRNMKTSRFVIICVSLEDRSLEKKDILYGIPPILLTLTYLTWLFAIFGSNFWAPELVLNRPQNIWPKVTQGWWMVSNFDL